MPRFFKRKKTVALAVLLLVTGLYLFAHSDISPTGQRSLPVTPRELSWRVERLVSKESWVEQGDFLPLNVTYQLLAGAPSPQQNIARMSEA